MISLDVTDKPEILRYLGYRGGCLTENDEKKLREAVDITNKTIKVSFSWRLFDIEQTKEGIALTDTFTVLKGESLKRHLKGYSRAVLFCITIGKEFDIALEKTMIKDSALGVFINSCGITAVEKAADWLQKEIDSELSMTTGQRFSPGYGDLPLESQRELLSLLNSEKKAGVRLNSNLLMDPVKSVSAIAGVK